MAGWPWLVSENLGFHHSKNGQGTASNSIQAKEFCNEVLFSPRHLEFPEPVTQFLRCAPKVYQPRGLPYNTVGLHVQHHGWALEAAQMGASEDFSLDLSDAVLGPQHQLPQLLLGNHPA